MFHFTQNIQVRQQWRWACNLWFRDSLTCVSRIAVALKTSLRISTCRVAMAISLSKQALVHIFTKFSIAWESFLTSTGEASIRVLAFSISMATGRRQTFIDVWKQNNDIRWRQSQFFSFHCREYSCYYYKRIQSRMSHDLSEKNNTGPFCFAVVVQVSF